MKSVSAHPYTHGTIPRIGVLLSNLGTPDAPTPAALRRYLKEFLSDPRVIELNRALWWCILNGIILQTRPAKSAALYQKIWTEGGSPLLQTTQSLAGLVKQQLASVSDAPLEVAFAMRYGNPSISSVLQQLRAKNVTKLIVLPLYPQYSATTTASTFDAVSAELRSWRVVPELRFITQYHDHDRYIAALAASIDALWSREGRPQKLIMSFHGMPERYLQSGDPYHCQCHKTARLVAERLGLERDHYIVTFQSLFGREEWLKPYTDVTLKALPASGVRSVDVICPGFSADCLETLEEIDQLNRENFLHAGGECYRYIPALNDSSAAVSLVSELVRETAGGWLNVDLQVLHRETLASRQAFERLRQL